MRVGARVLENTRGLSITLPRADESSPFFRAEWHSFKVGERQMRRPHYHRRPGISRHRPWEPYANKSGWQRFLSRF